MNLCFGEGESRINCKWHLKMLTIIIFLTVIQTSINYCEYTLRLQAVMQQQQEPLIYSTLLVAIGFMLSIATAIFFTFTRILRHLLKYIAVFEIDEDNSALFQNYQPEKIIKPTTSFFHMKRSEIKDRFCVFKTLTFSVVAIMMLLFYKYAIEIYRLMCVENVSNEADTGQSITDNMLMVTFLILFNTLLYASYKFKKDKKRRLSRR